MSVRLTPPSVLTPDQLRAEKCLAEIKRILAIHGCQILPQTVIVGSQIVQSGYLVVAGTQVPRDLKGDQ